MKYECSLNKGIVIECYILPNENDTTIYLGIIGFDSMRLTAFKTSKIALTNVNIKHVQRELKDAILSNTRLLRQTHASYSTSEDTVAGKNEREENSEVEKRTVQSQYDLIDGTLQEPSSEANIYDTLKSFLDGPVQSFTSFFAVQSPTSDDKSFTNVSRKSAKSGRDLYDFKKGDKSYGGIDVNNDGGDNIVKQDDESMSSSLYNVLYQYVPSLSRVTPEVVAASQQLAMKPKAKVRRYFV